MLSLKQVPENIPTHPKESYWKFPGVVYQKPKFVKEM